MRQHIRKKYERVEENKGMKFGAKISGEGIVPHNTITTNGNRFKLRIPEKL